jgi:predicted Zn-dependent peptidase
MTRRIVASLVLATGLLCAPAAAQQIPVQEHVLENGMTLLMVPRKGDPNVAAGWVAKVGSVNERPGITGLSHLFEHMMFKGTKTIGTTDFEEDQRVRARMDEVKARVRVEEQEQLRRYRLGEIADLADPGARNEAHRRLLEELAELEAEERALIVKNEFDRIYTAAGASGMNAGTSQDFTVYFINVPANKLELWFWMESDRLLNPVFREFYAEREVVREERRMRIESTPTGKYEEQFDAMFWSASPYGWPVVGWPSDIEQVTREEALAYFDLNYAPNNIAACLVGDFDPAEAIRLAERYFGRLERNPTPPPPVRTQEVAPLAERRMIAHAETNPQVEMRYLTVADGHRDEPALTVLGALLSGRTGRLYKSLVLDQKTATGARAGQNSLKWQGYFSAGATAVPGGKPEEVEQAIAREIEKLQEAPVGERELQKVKNQFAADSFRRVQSNFFLMLQLLLAENSRGWQSFNEDPKRIEAVTAADVQRVAQQYLKPETRTVALYHTKRAAPGEAPDPTLEGLTDAERQQVGQMRAMIAQMPIEQATQFLAKLEEAEASAPEDKRRLVAALKRLVQERIEKGGAQ